MKSDCEIEQPQVDINDYVQNVPKPVATFQQAFFNYPGIIDEVKKQKFENPTPIQSQMWPILVIKIKSHLSYTFF